MAVPLLNDINVKLQFTEEIDKIRDDYVDKAFKLQNSFCSSFSAAATGQSAV